MNLLWQIRRKSRNSTCNDTIILNSKSRNFIKLQKQISKNKSMKLIKESNPKNKIFLPIHNNKSPKLNIISNKEILFKTRFQSTTTTDGPSVKRRTVIASISQYIAYFQSLHFASSLIHSIDQQHGQSMHLWSIDAYLRSILIFSLTSGTGTVLDHINDLLGWFID